MSTPTGPQYGPPQGFGPPQPPFQVPPPPEKQRHTVRWIVLGALGALIGIPIVISLIIATVAVAKDPVGTGAVPPPVATAPAKPSQPATSAPASTKPSKPAASKPAKPAQPVQKPAPKPKPKPAPKPAPAPQGPSFSQQQAVDTAEGYLESQAFSKLGLIDQLKFEKFSKADATYAVNHITVDWREQAVLEAKDYLDSDSFSEQGLVEQLEFEQFTHSQAVHGAHVAFRG